MKILVTGGTGYIGSHTVVELQQKGYDVIIIDNLYNSSLSVLDGIEKITGIKPYFANIDLCDADAVNSFFAKHTDIAAIVHFAAYKAVGESVANPLKYYHNNLLSLINILQAIPENQTALKGFVFSSSCTVYGQPDVLPVNEQAPVQMAESPYGNTKQIGEEIIRDVVKQENYKAISLRYFNPVGAHASAFIGEESLDAPTNLVPLITQIAIGKRKKELEVFGNDYLTSDGTCIRDFIHVSDVAKAHVVSIERLLNNHTKSNFEVFNLGTGTGISVLEVVNMFEKVAGQKLPHKIVARRPGDIEKIYADTQLSNKELNWKAEQNLESMISSAWNWEKKIASKNNIQQ